MSHVEATTGSQTSTFAFASRLKIKSVQLVTVTSCTYLSKSVYYMQQKPRGFRLQTRVEAKKPSAKKKMHTIHSKSQGASDSKHEPKPRNLRPKKNAYYTLKMPRGF